MISPKVYALGECKDYLEYVTTKDTIAYTNGVQTYDIKEGTEFKMCFSHLWHHNQHNLCLCNKNVDV